MQGTENLLISRNTEEYMRGEGFPLSHVGGRIVCLCWCVGVAHHGAICGRRPGREMERLLACDGVGQRL